MRPFFAFLGLLFCLTPIRADEQAVIKDSDAIRYVGRYVEVRGVVVSVTTSPLGTAFLNFGREYPEQTFAGPRTSQHCKGKSSASSARSNFTRGSRRLK